RRFARHSALNACFSLPICPRTISSNFSSSCMALTSARYAGFATSSGGCGSAWPYASSTPNSVTHAMTQAPLMGDGYTTTVPRLCRLVPAMPVRMHVRDRPMRKTLRTGELSIERSLRNDQHVAPGPIQHLVGNAAEQCAPPRAATARPHHEQIRLL